MLDLKITPQREALIKGYNNELFALLQITTAYPRQKKDTENNLNLAIVIDKSGSMAGTPLEEAKQCAIMMIEKMHSSDRIAVVAYDHKSELVVPSSFCSDKQRIISLIKTIHEGGTTALHSGWLMGAEEVARCKADTSINRVLLLSDGNANHGLTDVEEIKKQCAQLADVGVTTSTYGIGFNFNEDLMIEMASSGLGQGYYGETAEDLSDPFQEEFALLLNTLATNIKLRFTSPDFVKIELLNSFRQNKHDWSMPDLASEGEVWALFNLKINKEFVSDNPIELLTCWIKYTTNDGEEKECEPVKLILDPLHPNAFSAIEENEKVKARLEELMVSEYQRKAIEAARAGNWGEVDHLVFEAKQVAKNNPWMRASLASLEEYSKRRQQKHFAKAAMYASDRMNKRLVSKDELDSNYDVNFEASKNLYLRRKTERGKRM